MKQDDLILDWLKKAPLTTLDAVKELGILQLGARISVLRDEGYHIETIRIPVVNRYGQQVRVAKYILKSGPNGKDVKRERKVLPKKSFAQRLLDLWG